ncbi:hypothetical protein D3C80_1443070 [compost metagenome]
MLNDLLHDRFITKGFLYNDLDLLVTTERHLGFAVESSTSLINLVELTRHVQRSSGIDIAKLHHVTSDRHRNRACDVLVVRSQLHCDFRHGLAP